MMDTVKIAREVFDTEIEALKKVRDALDETFDTIVKKIAACEGKLVITGVGKPGHIARKMAATFASLGTPSFYLHPSEAMHGDLGMVSASDIVLAISYSGESDEVIGILPSIKMIGAELIALTGNANSTLAMAADVVQVLPPFKEACHMQLAPTSSTTVELCYGDALAVVASDIYGFSRSDFGKIHPAGSLGKKLILKVDELMVKGDDMPYVHSGTNLEEAIFVMTAKRRSIVCITDDEGYLLGILTDADLRKVIAEHRDIYSTVIDDIMNITPLTFMNERLAVDALYYMKQNSVNVLPVVDGNKRLMGVIHIQQILKAGIVI
jgi:arabinose-5-phosphate isomerase